jgi:hypothetical protein
VPLDSPVRTNLMAAFVSMRHVEAVRESGWMGGVGEKRLAVRDKEELLRFREVELEGEELEEKGYGCVMDLDEFLKWAGYIQE